ncbi:unnamed protein product [Spirodela intermedia]|uniref:Uncharacterized protein n=1 Tax=Spirodela intermedia TaxID=51605 RepID=A0A7I8KPK2_SPIIN|nr:unnamed protein product [Spirodela intermedia]
MGVVELSEGTEKEKAGEEYGGRVVRWEKFLPQVYVRVLLVESDDSTRQIIAALLRKCNYRVAAAADGLKAWETLKEKPQNIDLVLTEVELPSMSGYGLLTMIMEHETCKNIPVIVMSSHDSVDMAFKCLLKGAADFLFKPIRKNELKNLWQHVWRRHLSDGLARDTHELKDANLTQKNDESDNEKNVFSDRSRDNTALQDKSSTYRANGRETQNSCTRLDIKVESTYLQNARENIQPDCVSSSAGNDPRTHRDDVRDKSTELVIEAACSTQAIRGREDLNSGVTFQRSFMSTGCVGEDMFCEQKPFREFDLIGAMDNHTPCDHGPKTNPERPDDASNNGGTLAAAKDENWNFLELSLKRHALIRTDNQEKDEFNALNHSNSSAFSRYSKTLSSPQSDLRKTELKDNTKDANGQLRDLGLSQSSTSQLDGSISDAYPQAVDCPTASLRTQRGIPTSHLEIHPFPVSKAGTVYSHGSLLQPSFYTQPGSPVWVSKPTNPEPIHSSLSHQSDQETPNSGKDRRPHGQDVGKILYKAKMKHPYRIESSNEKSLVSSVTSQSGTCNRDLASNNTSGLVDSNRSIHREEALKKFRLKRKDRCFEKKVQYHSRKRLADERPRVKGHFVRLLQPHPQPLDAGT